jgi:hypothetical protein
LGEIQFSAKINKLKSDNIGEYVHKVMRAFLETQGIIHDILRACAYDSNALAEHINCTRVMKIRLMTLGNVDVSPQAIWAEPYSTAVYIKNRLPHSLFNLTQSPYKIIFSDKPLIKHLYPFGAKCYIHISEEKQIRISKLNPREIMYFIISYTKSSNIFQLYDPKKHPVITSRVIVFPESTKGLEANKINFQANLPLNLDDNAHWTID